MAKFVSVACLLSQALLVFALILSAEGGADEEKEGTKTAPSSTVSPTAAGSELETTLPQSGNTKEDSAEDEGDSTRQQVVEANETISLGASRGSGGELIGTPPKWFCPIFHQDVVPESNHGKLLGYVVRLSDYDFLGYSPGVSKAIGDVPGRYSKAGAAYEPIMFNAPAEINVDEGSKEAWHWYYDQIDQLGLGIGLYRLRRFLSLTNKQSALAYSGISSNPPKLQTDINAPSKTCYAMFYSHRPGEASAEYKSVRQFVRKKINVSDCDSAGDCGIVLDNASICEALFEAGIPIICDGILSYIGVGSEYAKGCGRNMRAMSIANYYDQIKLKIDREIICQSDWRCFGPSSHTPSNMRNPIRRAPVGRSVHRKPVRATSSGAHSKQRNLRRP